jgi:hypothetical protein
VILPRKVDDDLEVENVSAHIFGDLALGAIGIPEDPDLSPVLDRDTAIDKVFRGSMVSFPEVPERLRKTR